MVFCSLDTKQQGQLSKLIYKSVMDKSFMKDNSLDIKGLANYIYQLVMDKSNNKDLALTFTSFIPRRINSIQGFDDVFQGIVEDRISEIIKLRRSWENNIEEVSKYLGVNIPEIPIDIEANKTDISYKGEFENKGKGTPKGDGKDKAMREIADSFIGEVAKKDSSSYTSAIEIGNKSEIKPIKQGDTLTTLSGDVGVVMLARNSEFKGKPLSQITKDRILRQHNKGAEFVVGDMPNVDSQFIDYLQEIGAKFTIYHTGNESRIKIQEKQPLKTNTDNVGGEASNKTSNISNKSGDEILEPKQPPIGDVESKKADIERRRQVELLVPQPLNKLPDYLEEIITSAVKRLSIQEQYDIVREAINGKTAQQIVSSLNLVDEEGRRNTEIVIQVEAYYGIPSQGTEGYKEWKNDVDKINAKYDAELEEVDKQKIVEGNIAMIEAKEKDSELNKDIHLIGRNDISNIQSSVKERNIDDIKKDIKFDC